jgi:hypothetical protein
MSKLNEYRRIIGYSYLLYIVLIIPVSLLHELGHVAICSANGYQFDMWLDLRGGHSLCYGLLGDDLVMGAMGGIFGLLASLGILAYWHYFCKKAVPIAAVALALMLDQGIKILLEGFLPGLYSAGRFDLLITIVQIISVAVFAIYFTRSLRREDDSSRYLTRESKLGV